ncbi:MAG: dihydrodipicolinate synthase family protein [Chloroflexota bacterium]
MKYRKSEAKEYTREHMKGIWAAIPCPFTEDDQLDEAALRKSMRYYIEELKIDGFFCGGLIGEFWALTTEERKRLQKVVVEECYGKAQIIAHTGHQSVGEAISLTRHAEEVGADYAIHINPYFAAKGDRHVKAFFTHLCENVDIGVSLFNSSLSGVTLSPRLIAELADIENICCVKNAQSMEHHVETLRLAGEKIVCSEPSEKNWMINHAYLGQQVFMSSPEPYLYQRPGKLIIRDYTRLIDEGRIGEAKKLSYTLTELRGLFEKWIMEPWKAGTLPIAYLKHWCALLGMPGGGKVRPPLLQITVPEKEEMKADLQRVGLIG